MRFWNARLTFLKICAVATAVLLLCSSTSWALMDIKKEREVGEEVLQQVKRQLKIVEDPEITQYVNQIGNRILANIGHTLFTYDFYVVDNNTMNAFAIPGGHIFINRGMIEIMSSEDELAGVLSHEIAHVQSRHFAQRVEKGKVATIGAIAGALLAILVGGVGGGNAGSAVMTGAMAATQSLMLSYSRADEEEADRKGLSYMEEGGFNVQAMASVFNKMIKTKWIDTSAFPAYLSTHPGLDERIVYLENAVAAHHPATIEAIEARRQQRFNEMKVRLIALYEAPGNAYDKLARLISANPRNSMAYYGMALLQLRMNRYGEAIAALKKAAELNPNNATFYQTMGVSYFYMGDMKNAQAALSQSIIVLPNDAVSRYFLGQTYEQEGQWELALQNFNKARVLNPDLEELYYHMAKVNNQLGRVGEAHLLYGVHSKEEGNIKNAQFHFRKALELYQGNPAKIAEIEGYLKDLKEKKRPEKPEPGDKGPTNTGARVWR